MMWRKNESGPATQPAAPRFSSTDHLSAEAVAAFVDHELSPSAERRAADHVAQCPECLADIVVQQRAAERLRRSDGAEEVHAPSSLVQRLAGLREEDLPEPDGGRGAGAAAASAAPAGPLSAPRRAISKVEAALRALRGRG